MELRQRIEELVVYSKKSIPQFAEFIGVKTPQAIRELTSGRTKTLSENMQDKILRAFPEISKAWLLAGVGNMLVDTGGFVEVPDEEILNSNPKPGDKVVMVPLINIDSVGSMERNNSLTWRDQFVVRHIPFVDARHDDVAIYQSGDSMTPGIPSGSILHIRQVHDWQEYFGYGDTFVLWLKDDRRITKQVLKYREDPKNYVVCHSFNPAFEDEELPKKFIRQVWKVITILSDKGW